jgi:retrotransposon gag protein
MCDRKLKHQRLRNFAARNQGLIIHPFSTLPVAKRTRAHILEQARHIPLPNSESSSSDEKGEYIFEMGDQTLKQLAAPTFDPKLLCIVDDEAEIEIKPGLIRALPTFSGFRNTNSLGSVHMNEASRFLKEFHIACAGMKLAGVTLDQLKLKAFPFALSDAAKEWLFEVPAGTITTWDQMLKVFAERYFPASLIANIRKEICGIRQDDAETLHEYWERFKKLCDSCPNHQISEQLLVQYFYEGLRETDKNLVDAASGGALVDKTPAEEKKLIANMAANSQYRGGRNIISTSVRQVNEVVSTNLEQQVAKLTSLVERVFIEKGQEKACGICSMVGHPIDMCPTMQEEQVNSIGGGQGQQKFFQKISESALIPAA